MAAIDAVLRECFARFQAAQAAGTGRVLPRNTWAASRERILRAIFGHKFRKVMQ